VRANVFRFTPKLGHGSEQLARLKRALSEVGRTRLSRSAPLASSLRVGNQHVQLAMLLYEITMYAIDVQGLKIETD
jgi:hypothetical protein